MLLSKHFLKDYLDLDLNFQEVAEKMVFAGNEYESLSKLSTATNVVIGKVIECKMHPESDHLHLCKIDVGNEVLDIVCGAPNMKEGIKVMVAKVGAILPGGVEIKKARLAGYDSCGMCCSLSELGIEAKYQSEEDKNGIHILEEDAPLGEDAISYLGLDDEVIDFELTADRGDLLSVLGMAYEVGALYDTKVNLPSLSFEEEGDSFLQNGSVTVESDHCSLYTAKLVKNVTIEPSPSWMQARLIASGIRPINNVVDISNSVMLEYGQPLHFFDADKLGNKIIVRQAEAGETLTTLDGVERTLTKEDIVIANENGAVALAGVMGGLDTEVTEDTKNIMIESAIFDPITIRYTAKRVLRSEASNRYEKGIDPNRTELALHRACHLLEKYANATVEKGLLKCDRENYEDKKIDLSLAKINQVLGMELSKEDVLACLRRLDFEVACEEENFCVMVPTRRMDVNIVEDLIEEIGRIYGFDKVEGSLPVTKLKQGTLTPSLQFTKEVKHHLACLGLQEVLTYTLVSKEQSELFLENQPCISVMDPMSEDRKYLRRSLLPSLLEVYSYNAKRGQRDLSMFEVSNVYSKEDQYVEHTKLAILLSGSHLVSSWQNIQVANSFYVLKGMVESLLQYLGIGKNRYSFQKEAIKDMHPSRCATIWIDGKQVGFLGQVHPELEKKEVYVCELSLDLLRETKVRPIKYKEVSKYPGIVKDMAFVVSKDTSSGDLKKVIEKAGGRLLTDVLVFDVYEGENLEDSQKSIAYKLTFEDPTKTLTEEEVMMVFHNIVTEVCTKCEATLRDK